MSSKRGSVIGMAITAALSFQWNRKQPTVESETKTLRKCKGGRERGREGGFSLPFAAEIQTLAQAHPHRMNQTR